MHNQQPLQWVDGHFSFPLAGLGHTPSLTHPSGHWQAGLRKNRKDPEVLFSISDPHNLKICCRVNGEVVQSSNTNQMVFKTEELIAWVSQYVGWTPS